MRASARWVVVIVIAALITGTFGWLGRAAAPIGYDSDVSGAPLAHTMFLMAGLPAELGAQGVLTIRSSRDQFEMDWTTASGASIHISERMAPYALLFAADPTSDAVVAMAGNRARWREGTALDGRVRALRATIGRIFVSIEGDLSYEDLFRIAQTLRPGYAPLL